MAETGNALMDYAKGLLGAVALIGVSGLGFAIAVIVVKAVAGLF